MTTEGHPMANDEYVFHKARKLEIRSHPERPQAVAT
jgi:hypothetical protein